MPSAQCWLAAVPGITAIGTVTGTAARWCTDPPPTTETAHGMVATYGSSGSVYGPNGAAHYGRGYNPSTGTYARGATVSNGYGSRSVGQAYNPRTGAYGDNAARLQCLWKLGKLDRFKKWQHRVWPAPNNRSQEPPDQCKLQTAARRLERRVRYNSAAVGKTANGNKYATANGKAYSNTGSGWQQKGGTSDDALKSSSSGWGQAEKSGGSSAFGGGASGWESRADSARGFASRGGGGGWGGGHFGGFHGRR